MLSNPLLNKAPQTSPPAAAVVAEAMAKAKAVAVAVAKATEAAVAEAKGIGKAGRCRGKTKRGRGTKTRSVAILMMPPRRGIPKVATQGKPLEYKGGKIYFPKGFFMCIREAGNYASEKQLRVGRYASVEQTWLHALKSIDDHIG